MKSSPSLHSFVCSLAAAVSLIASTAAAQDRDVRVTVSEGTNMAAAVSPDGQRIVIDLQGTLWVREADGTEARAITDMYYDARQPQWSPDGSRIVFQSFRDGNWHIWSIAADGSDPQQHTFGPYDEREPQYSPDGEVIAFSSDRTGNYDVWVLSLEDGERFQLTETPSHEFTPSFAPDGQALTYASSREGGSIWVRRRADDAEEMVATAPGATSPSWSPDGQYVAFPGVGRGGTGLYLAELGTGADTAPTLLSEQGDDVFPFRPHWMGDDEIVYTSDGVIKNVDREGSQGPGYAFSATFEFTRPGYERERRSFEASGPEPVRGVVAPAVSPDGQQVVFTALGDIWLLDAARGATPRQLTDDPFVDVQPVWSRDGRRIAYATDREGSLDIWVRDMDSGAERRVTTLPGGEVAPVFSPDGRQIAFTSMMGLGSQLQMVDLASGEVRTIRDDLFAPSRPSFSPDGSTIAMAVLTQYSSRFREGRNEILLQPLDGREGRRVTAAEHKGMGGRALDGPVWSPDGHHMAYVSDGVLWNVDVDGDGTPIGAPDRLTNHHADALSWTGDSQSIVYQSIDGLRRVWLEDGRVEEIPLDLSWQRSRRATSVVVHAARVWDGLSDDIDRNVDLIVEGSRIQSVVPHSDANHTGEVVDAGDHTVIPGLIDMHAHLGYGMGEALGRVFLAYGVTTIRDPSSDSYEIRERRESIDSGRRIGPREFATGRIMDGNRIYYSIAAALGPNGSLDLELDRADKLDYSLIKTYVRMPDLMQRRIIEFAHGMGIPVSSHEIYPAVALGADHVEHIGGTSRRGYSPKVTAMQRTYDDVIQLLTASGMTLTPTMALSGGWGWAIAEDPDWLTDTRFQTLFPPGMAQQMAARAAARGAGEGAESRLRDVGSTVTRVVRGGGRVVAGTDSPIIPYGAALVAEVESYVWGGLTELEALKSATSVPGAALAMEGEIGTLTGGAFADMLIVEGNPLDDISDLRRMRWVIKDGQVFALEDLLSPPRALVP